MNLYILILAFSIVEANSYERFIKTANGPKIIHCDQNSFFFTNSEHYDFSCNDQSSCEIRSPHHVVNYVCIKQQFQESKCNLLENNLEVPEKSGCFRTKNHFVDITWNSKKYIHMFLLTPRFTDKNDGITYSEFSTFSCLQCHLDFWTYTRILLKVSDKSEADFGEFFMEDNPKTTLERKDDAFTVSNLDHVNNSSTKETPMNCLPVDKVIIILVPVVIILMTMIIALVVFIFYRQKTNKTPKAVTAKGTNEIPLNENERNDLNT